MVINNMLMDKTSLLLFAVLASCWMGCEKSQIEAVPSSQARKVLDHIDNMAQLLARGEVSYDLNSLLAAEMMSVSNRNEKSMLLGKYEDAMARFMVSRLKPEYETLRKAWGFRDFFHAAHQTVCTVSSNHIEGVYFTLKMIALLNAEAENLDAKLMKLNDSAHAQQTYSGPDLSERGCLIVCARGLRDDAKSLAYQYIDMPRHLFDEYTVGCTPREKKKIVEDIETIIGRAPKFF